MPEEIKYEYHGVTITYNEQFNQWGFTLRGRERSVESLAKAKETIDRPVKSTKANTFTRVKVMIRSSGAFHEGEVTSIASYRYGRPEVWVSWTIEGRPQRSKLYATDVYPVSPENQSAIDKLRAIDEQRLKLSREREAIADSLKPYVPPEPEPESD